VTGYQVLRGADNGTFSAVATTTSARFVERGLEPGTAYTYRVRALNAAGASPPSAAVTAVPFTTAGKPRHVTARSIRHGIRLRWRAPADNGGREITAYVVQYATCSLKAARCRIRQKVVRGTKVTLKRLSPHHRYFVRVRAVTEAGDGTWSHQVKIRLGSQRVMS
jgi:predicted phage tail protein